MQIKGSGGGSLTTEKFVTAAASLAQEFCSAENSGKVLSTAAGVFRDITGASRVMVYLAERRLDSLVVKADTGKKNLGKSFSLSSGEFPCRVLKSRKIYSEHGKVLGHPLKARINGYLGMPLICRHGGVGLIEFFEPEYTFLENPGVLKALSFPVSMGLRNLQIVEELQMQSEVLDIINRIAKIAGSSLRIDAFYDDFALEVKKLVDFDRISIALVDEKKENIKVYALATNKETKLGRGVVLPLTGTAPGWVIENKKPIIVKDLKQEMRFCEDLRLVEEGMRSALRLPLVINDNVLATLQVNSSKVGIYGDRELSLLQKVANRIAEAVENTVLFNRAEMINQQLKQQNIRLEAINAVASAVNESLELEVVLQKSLDKVLEVTGWNCGGILTWDEENELISIVVHRGLSNGFIQKWQEHRKASIGYKTAITGKTTYISRVDDSPEQEYLRREGIVSTIHIPLYSKQKLVGVMPIGTKAEGAEMPDRELLYAIGKQIGVAIENAMLYQQIRDLAEKDSLTGLWNRRKFFEFLAQEVIRSQRYKSTFALLMIDVDHFKEFNDAFGHFEGDKVLAAVGQIIQNSIRENDYAARLGGEEFAVIAFRSDAAGAWEMAERIRCRMEEEGTAKPFPTVSIGFSICPESGRDAHDLFLAADDALYKAKNTGRNKTSGQGV